MGKIICNLQYHLMLQRTDKIAQVYFSVMALYANVERFFPWCSHKPKRKRNLSFQSRVRHFSCRDLQSYNSPGDWARELFKPSTDSTSLVVQIENRNFSFWVWTFLGGTSQV